jgi:hypothetical protein
MRIAVIVEGDGEVEAVPVLLRRYAVLLGYSGNLRTSVFRQPASRLVKPGELERVVELAARKLGGTGGILILLDSEDGCPAQDGPALLARVRHARSDLPSGVILAHREFEAWFLGAASSLAGRRALPMDLCSHPNPESVRACKEWLSRKMPMGRAYNEVEDQPALTAIFDMDLARAACPSFDKCDREIRSLFAKLTIC